MCHQHPGSHPQSQPWAQEAGVRSRPADVNRRPAAKPAKLGRNDSLLTDRLREPHAGRLSLSRLAVDRPPERPTGGHWRSARRLLGQISGPTSSYRGFPCGFLRLVASVNSRRACGTCTTMARPYPGRQMSRRPDSYPTPQRPEVRLTMWFWHHVYIGARKCNLL